MTAYKNGSSSNFNRLIKKNTLVGSVINVHPIPITTLPIFFYRLLINSKLISMRSHWRSLLHQCVFFFLSLSSIMSWLMRFLFNRFFSNTFERAFEKSEYTSRFAIDMLGWNWALEIYIECCYSFSYRLLLYICQISLSLSHQHGAGAVKHRMRW